MKSSQQQRAGCEASPSSSEVAYGTTLDHGTTEEARDSSPVSVLAHPASASVKEPSSRHGVPKVTMMYDDGSEIEVTLDLNPATIFDASPNHPLSTGRPPLKDLTNVAVTPTKRIENRKVLPTNSLLDVEITPSPLPDKTQRLRSLGTDMLCGVGVEGCLSSPEDHACGSSALVTAPQRQVEQTIQLLLGNPMGLDVWCHGWQAWLFFGHCENEDDHRSGSETKENMKRVLRNRAYDLNSKTRRIRMLNDDFSPFDSSPQTDIGPVLLSKTRSFSLPSHAYRRSGDGFALSASSDVSESVSSLLGCGQPTIESPAAFHHRELGSQEDDLCYDSDPEEITRRYRSDHESQNDERDDKFLSFNSTNELSWTKSGKHRGRDLCKPRRLDAVFDHHDVPDVVQEFMNEKFTLVWHRSIKPYVRSKGTPQAMKVWIERGQRLRAGLIQPKLVWRPIQDHEGEQRQMFSTLTIESIELLDISRILEVNRIDRNIYPYAKKSKCLLLESLDRKIMFETSSESERDRIVNTLKLAVARLASKVIVQDDGVLDEFFTPFVTAVPGEAPRWTQDSNTLSLL